MKHQAYLNAIAHRFTVWITPASRVGGEFPIPVPFHTCAEAAAYARACRQAGQLARVEAPTQPKPKR
jgi:hypothetical protein